VEDDNDLPEFRSLYICTKSNLAAAEGLGIHSSLTVQARVLITLFEVVHGFYPAAYISIAATIRAADALDVHPEEVTALSHASGDGAKDEDAMLLWSGIIVLDR